MTVPCIEPDVAILGGGVAGLWTLNRLRSLGFTALLFEAFELGGGQTVNAQGIIHGGVKYLPGKPSDQGELAAMPATWRDCLAGRGPVDLKGCRVLSDYVHLFSSSSLPARLVTALAGRQLRARVEKLSPQDWPTVLQAATPGRAVYRVDEPVLDMPSLVRALVQPVARDIFHIDPQTSPLHNENGQARLLLPDCTVRPRLLLLAAGAGNAGLLKSVGAHTPAMRRLPLQQVVLSGPNLPPLFAHCLGADTTTRFSVSSHGTAEGNTLWYIGGGLASAGAEQPAGQLIERARRELTDALPGLDLSGCHWATVPIDRAEGQSTATRDTGKPFVATVEGVANALAAWPTKLALAPALGERIEGALRERKITPGAPLDLAPLSGLPRPAIARPAWEALTS